MKSVEQALKVAGDCALARAAREIMVVGGAAVYAALLPKAARVYLSRVHAVPEGDAGFPELDLGLWREISSEYHPRGEKDEFDYTISVFERAGTNDAA